MSFHLTQAFEGAEVRIAGTPERPLFVAKDLCDLLGTDSRNVPKILDHDEVDTVHVTDSVGRNQEFTAVTESGLYHLVFKSRKAAARRFRRWVTDEVLPAIRKTGAFHADMGISDDLRTLTLTQWIGTLGLDLRDDARTVNGLLNYVTRASNQLRWWPSIGKSRNPDTFFQEVPMAVLNLAEGMWTEATSARRAELLPAPRADEGGTISQILAGRAAVDAETVEGGAK